MKWRWGTKLGLEPEDWEIRRLGGEGGSGVELGVIRKAMRSKGRRQGGREAVEQS